MPPTFPRGRPVSFFATLCLGTMFVFGASGAEAPQTVRLLTIGNSFAYNATRYLRPLAEAAGHRVILGSANSSGCSLEKHWTNLEKNLGDSSTGRIYPKKSPSGPKRSLPEFFEKTSWDYVSIQQLSTLSDKIATYRPYAERLCQFIKENAPGAEIIIMQTWAYRVDDRRFNKEGSSEEMHQAVQKAYRKIAGELGLRVVPVGEAFALASASPEWTYRPDPNFDSANAKYPDLPKQPGSLHVGWTWIQPEDEPRKLILDGHHANIFGRYLGSCVYFEFLFGESPVGNPFVPPGITPEQARSLQEFAHEAILSTSPASSLAGRP